MGVVYLARDPVLERDVAIKMLTSGNLLGDQRERFEREARAVAKLDHPREREGTGSLRRTSRGR